MMLKQNNILVVQAELGLLNFDGAKVNENMSISLTLGADLLSHENQTHTDLCNRGGLGFLYGRGPLVRNEAQISEVQK